MSPTTSEGTTLGALAEVVGGRLVGDPGLSVRGLAPVESAGPDETTFLAARRYARQAGGSRAGSFLVAETLEAHVADRPRVVVAEPHRALLLALRWLHPSVPVVGDVHPTAVVGRGVRLGRDVRVGPYAVLEEGVQVGDASSIGAHVVVGRGCVLGGACTLHPMVVLYPGTRLGHRVIVHAGTVLGADGFGYVPVDGVNQRIPHVGGVVLGDDVEIGANAAVDRGALGDTVVEEGVKVDNLVQIGHNVRVGAHTMMAGMAGVAGSAHIGRGVLMGGQSGIVGHVEVGDGARIAAASKALKDVPAGATFSGNPARHHRDELRRQALLGRLPTLVARVAALEAEVAALKGGGAR